MTLPGSRCGAAALAILVPLGAGAQEVRNREANQQGRIAEGIGSGQITASGASRLERREARIDASRRTDLADNGGHLTGAEYRRLNSRQNALSNRIFIDKHNDVAQPGIMPR